MTALHRLTRGFLATVMRVVHVGGTRDHDPYTDLRNQLLAMMFSRLPQCVLYGVVAALGLGPVVVFATRAIVLASSADGSPALLVVLLAATPVIAVIASPVAIPAGVIGGASLSWWAARTAAPRRLGFDATLAGAALGAVAFAALSAVDVALPQLQPALSVPLFVLAGSAGGWLTWRLAFRDAMPVAPSPLHVPGRRWIGLLRRRTVVVVGLVMFSIVALPVLALSLYLVAGIATGFFEQRAERDVRTLLLPDGQSLEAALERRLAATGVALPATWSTTGFGSHSISTACVEHVGRRVCLAFELGHRERKLSASNPLAASLFPELPKRVLPLGWTLDSTQLSDLAVVRRRSGDIPLPSP